MVKEVYPLTIIKDRYSGTYSGGVYTAWNKEADEIPTQIYLDDISCMNFWSTNKEIVGIGLTPNLAEENLRMKLELTNGKGGSNECKK